MAIELYIVRHAEAGERDAAVWPDDSQRPLTPKGRKRFAKVARALRQLKISPDVVLSSRFVRAWQTAEILKEHSRWPDPQPCEALEMMPASEVVAALAAVNRAISSAEESRGGENNFNRIVVVGHEPSLSELASDLLTGDEHGIAIHLAKGGVMALQFDSQIDAGRATLLWSTPPMILRRARR